MRRAFEAICSPVALFEKLQLLLFWGGGRGSTMFRNQQRYAGRLMSFKVSTAGVFRRCNIKVAFRISVSDGNSQSGSLQIDRLSAQTRPFVPSLEAWSAGGAPGRGGTGGTRGASDLFNFAR